MTLNCLLKEKRELPNVKKEREKRERAHILQFIIVMLKQLI